MRWVPASHKPKDIKFGDFCDKVAHSLGDFLLDYRISDPDGKERSRMTHTLVDRDKRACVVTIEFFPDGESE